MKNNWLLTIIIAIVVAAGGFYAGMTYQKNKATASFAGGQFQGGVRQGGQFGTGRGRFGGATVGNVISEDANSITVQLPDGSSKIVNISGSTTFSKSDTASKSDVQNGMRIAAFGTANSDGSINATNVQLNPPIGMRGGNRGSGSSSSARSQY